MYKNMFDFFDIISIFFREAYRFNDSKVFKEEDQIISKFNKFISADYRYCGGFGNQLFHVALYYGIGRHLNRNPFYFVKKGCDKGFIKNVQGIFPNIAKHVKLLTPKRSESIFINPLSQCCNLSHLTKFNEKYLIFKKHIPHFYHFFHDYRDEIRYFMEFNIILSKNILHFANTLFKNDSSHKFCIHIRRGDFMNPSYRYQESKSSFIIPATTHIYKYLRDQGLSNISLILLGQDDKFKHSLSFNSTLFTKIYYPIFGTRNQEFAFGSKFCETFLISATASTFAWWIAYLMPEQNRNIFYNGQVYKKGNSSKYIFENIFPTNWNKIDLTM